ncbi:MAG: hypothetical protein UW95_C0022G0009 [Parcubacteria group bacterium GW2011_GWC1_45_14]|nr:MAG: hypothetical protein UW87_C0008G0002 [Candidatus Moranbacteria bacterium GW2011_GWC2_45_10]KKT93514.1 MAG: hypothetical protein UW95_C0022G0009 [Parcubacteria group bacterium GW2011_GWC1_45_14]
MFFDSMFIEVYLIVSYYIATGGYYFVFIIKRRERNDRNLTCNNTAVFSIFPRIIFHFYARTEKQVCNIKEDR